MASTADVLGVIFAVFLVLGGIAIAVWYFEFRKPSTADGPKQCTKDADCSGGTGAQQEQYTGEVCKNGTCQNVACAQSNNTTCATKAPGTTCFGLGPPGARSDQSCLPMSCRTTDDCAGPGGDAMKENVVCVPGSNAGQGICVPQKPLDGKGGCFAVLNLTAKSNTCIVCGEGATSSVCRKGSYCVDGRCFRCGNTGTNLCENQKGTQGPGPWDLCDSSSNMCSTANSRFECKTTLQRGGSGSEEPIQLPDGSTLGTGMGICLPSEGNCAFSWFNDSAAPTGSAAEPFPGQCPATAPYCSVQGSCEHTPLGGGGAVCGYLPGVGGNGKVTVSSGDAYDVTGICSGRLVPSGSYANPANFGIDGNPIRGADTTCKSAGSENKAKNCMCDPNKNECPEGTYCQPISVSMTNGGPSTMGFCTISAGTGTSSTLSPNSKVPLSGHLGHYYANSFCAIPPEGGDIPICIQQPSSSTSLFSLNGPGDFCYDTSQCLYGGKVQGPRNTLGALVCEINRCVGGTVAQ